MRCRSCDGETVPTFSLGEMPLANSLLSRRDEPYKTYPLDLVRCAACSLVQLAETVPPDELFVDYSYLTSYSTPMVQHAATLFEEVVRRKLADHRSLVVEVGSNDGYLLQHYVRRTIPVLGIDPSERAADAAKQKYVSTVRDFFSLKLARELGPIADVIHANNVLAHVPDLNDFAVGLAHLLKPSGTLIIEVPYLCELITKTAFDTIYHEHVYYFSLTALQSLFASAGLVLNDLDRLDVHGGSLRLWLSRSGEPSGRVRLLLAEESLLVNQRWYYEEFAGRVERCKRDTRQMLAGKRVAGFGAAAKATIFLNACGIDSLDCIADDTPTKQGKFIPGVGTCVVPVADWLAGSYDETLILAWNFAHAIAHRYRTEYRGHFFTWYTQGLVAA